jgi:Domain of unknown function (DUF1924)
MAFRRSHEKERRTRATIAAAGKGFIALLAVAGNFAAAELPTDYMKSLQAAARTENPGFTAFSAQRGQAWFNARHGTDWSCSTCHTENPLDKGRHATTGRSIAPMAPATNPDRLTDAAKIEKWFKRNCGDVIGRACTPIEKGDVIAYLTSLKP